MQLHIARRIGLVAALAFALQACSALQSGSSPDLVYSSDAESARQLQVPPDLTDISDTEQFVLPGQNGGQVKRNTLLPQFESIRFVRDVGENWLAIDAAPETVWPQLLAFLRKDKYRVEQTAPTAGVISTQWRKAEKEFSRIAFRLERDGTGTRLFARSQASPEEPSENTSGSGTWPSSSHDPEAISALLIQLMTFLGVEEQKARGILSQGQATAVLDDAYLQRTAAGSQLLINKGYEPSYNAIVAALKTMNLPIEASSSSIGRIQFSFDAASVLLDLKPLHISAVVVELKDENGQRLETSDESGLLQALRDAIV